jgi:hypothetical protein
MPDNSDDLSVNNFKQENCILLGYYHHSLRNNPEEHSSHLLGGGSLIIPNFKHGAGAKFLIPFKFNRDKMCHPT